MNKNMIEIERKFLVKKDLLPKFEQEYLLIQGYLVKNEYGSIRVRTEMLLNGGEAIAYLMSKTKIDEMSNYETVDEISLENAERYLRYYCGAIIRKTRGIIHINGMKWEVDHFDFPNPGLYLAEIELSSAQDKIELPEWIDREVTGESQYYNVNM